jgi:hypothetical protein
VERSRFVGLNDRVGGTLASIFFLILVCEAIGTAATRGLFIVPASGDSEDDCGEADGM